MLKPEKAKKLIDYLEERLISGQYSAGSKIPSVRRLADKFDVSYGTALRGIDYLCEDGRFEKIPNRGVFVRGRAKFDNIGAVRRIAVFMEPYVTEAHCGMCHTAFLGMQELALKHGFTFMVNPLMCSDASQEVIEKMSEGAEGVILLNEYDQILKKLKLKVPVVGVLLDNSFNGAVSTVNLDPWNAARDAAEYFEKKAAKKVTVISSHKPVFVTRGRTFAMVWKEKGYECEIQIYDQYPEFVFEKGAAYLFTSDQYAHNFSNNYFEYTGKNPLDICTMIGMDGKQLIDPSFQRFPTIAVNWKAIGEIAFNECLSRIEDPTLPPKNITVTGKKLNF